MVHAKYVARIGIVVTALIFGWALLGSPGVAMADTTSNSGATGTHAPRTGHAAPKQSTARKAPVAVTRSARPQPTARAKPAASATSNSIVSDVTACACNLVKAVATQVAVFVSELRPPVVPQPPPDPFGAWMALAWVRKQADDAFAQIAAQPVVKQVVQAVRHFAEQSFDAIMACGSPPTGSDVFDRTTIASGLTNPTDFALLPDGRILITEKGGAIRIYENGALTAAPLVTLPTRTEGERGLLGIAVDPDFATNGYVYVAYTTTDAHYQLSRLTVTDTGIAPASEFSLYRSPDEEANFHQGGALAFGPDGKLYWGIGDNTVGANAQDLSNIHGKILRLNPTDGTAPQDNPFVNTAGAESRIWAYGLRNPFRLDFTPDGRLLAGDVGQNAVEELDLITKGANYGWPNAEGTCATCTSTNPIYTYDHSAGSAAITSVLFYSGDAFGPSYQDKVFIADYIRGWIKVLTFNSTFSTYLGTLTFDSTVGSTVKLAQGPDGTIYQLTIFPGELSILTPTD
ncbi:glucose/arabinose dehydrogenase [Mycolicibacterium sp. BK634]|uniref:PQQ-dependent sugar dehydrogenase n=1 Tax=Mycolicibacterium sp. BK634 TaxID=2587099 RepID=UPI001817BC93|nr:PQQ-dependent sugar dehydrogenase [Mycolicibacterium sp. BK634]MBB3750758.1 glucose/arabinose dehydrogenase [Mycolicibacterium sp. BK634]